MLPRPKLEHSPFEHFSKIWPQIEFGTSIRYIQNLKIKDKQCDCCSSCWHDSRGHSQYDEENVTAVSDNLETERTYGQHILLFLQCLRRGGLQSFSWAYGACIPSDILGPDGYLPRFQTTLEKLSLTTRPPCETRMRQDDVYDLSAFGNLREFSWDGPQNVHDYIALDDCLQLNSLHLESLTLDLLDDEIFPGLSIDDFKLFGTTGPRYWFFAKAILHITDENEASAHVFRFPALKTLSLTGAPLWSCARLSECLSFSQLECLILRNCLWAGSLLDHLTKSRMCLQLRSINICYAFYMENPWDTYLSVPRSLDTLLLLEEAFLCFPFAGCNEITTSLCGHICTLKRIAIHDRDCDMEAHLAEDRTDWYNDGVDRLLTEGRCDIISMSIDMDTLRDKLKPHVSHIRCKILHVRATDDHNVIGLNKIDGFANWVFGLHGISGLLVLAFGDFTLLRGGNFLFCRNEVVGIGQPVFRDLTPSDSALWELVEQSMDALSACPLR